MMNKVIQGLLIGLFGASLGFGASQMTAIGPVREQMSEVRVEIRTIKDTQKEDRLAVTDRIFAVTRLVESQNALLGKVVEQNRELITTIRLQNEILKTK